MIKKVFLDNVSLLTKDLPHYNQKQTITIIILVLFFIGCSHKSLVINKNTLSFDKFPIEDKISFSDIYEYKEGVAGMLELVDSTLIIFNVSQGINYFLNNYSLKSGQLSKGYLSQGKGPGEAIGARAIGVNGNTLWLYDISLKKIMTIDVTKIISDNMILSFNEYPVIGYHYMIGFKDSLHYFGVGSKSSAFKIQEVELISSKETNEYGKFAVILNNIPFISFKSAYESFIFTKPTGDKIVLPYRFLDAIEIYDVKKQTSVVVHGPEGFDVKFEPLPNGIERTKETRFAFVNGTVTNKYIYMSYSGLLCDNENSYYGNCVYVYDWEGNPIRKLVLDRQIEGLVVSADDKTMYAYDVNSGFLIESNIN
ncbi:MAG: BF3164 family lipoprotein [Ignavibacteria bacterium]|nr:BF3164 family lipoprotein [Ignavibacteria bacterium]